MSVPEVRAVLRHLLDLRQWDEDEIVKWSNSRSIATASKGVPSGTASRRTASRSQKTKIGAAILVEIAYGIVPGYQGQGYATEAAAALVEFAFGSGQVSAVRAHTVPTTNASTRVLKKCGFQCLGEVDDPEDGVVWRWERTNEPHSRCANR